MFGSSSGRTRFCFLTMQLHTSSLSTSRTFTPRIFSAMMRSHFSPASSSSFRIVVWWTPVTRSMLETLLPSSKSERTISAFSTGRYMASSGFSRGSRNVFEHCWHLNRWLPFRSLPCFWQAVLQLWHVTVNLLEVHIPKRDPRVESPYGFGCADYDPG